MQHSRKIATGLLVAVLLVLASVGGVTAATAEETSTEDGNVFTRGLRGNRDARDPDATDGRDRTAFWELIATNLGLDRSTVETAAETAKAQWLAEAVAAGTISQATADKLNSFPGHRWGHRHDGGYPLPDFIAVADLQQRVAENLGVTVEELETAKEQGRTGWASLNIDRASLRTAVREALQQLRDEAVAAGTITQTEAEAWMQDTRWKGHDCSSGLDDDDETVEPNA